jgi:hypothetical protein
MIHILFVPGAFGSMLEWGIRSYSSNYADPLIEVKDDGSMHIHNKMYHPISYSDLIAIDAITDPMCITTTIYPMGDYHSNDIVEFFNNPKFDNSNRILLDVPNADVAELILLMQYYKISIGLEKTLDSIFNNDIAKHNIVNWNTQYTHWSEMQPWELREWFSIFYPTWISEWVNTSDLINENWLVINPMDLVNNYTDVVKRTIEFCKLNYIANEQADVISKIWCAKQLPIIMGYNIINQIVEKTIKNESFSWDKLNIIHEAIIQKKLRDNGYEIKCYNLNNFPCSSLELYGLLDQ